MGKQDPILSQILANRKRYLEEEKLNKQKLLDKKQESAKTPQSVIDGTDPDYGAPEGFQDQATFGKTPEERTDSSKKLIQAEIESFKRAKEQQLLEQKKALETWNDPKIQAQFELMKGLNAAFNQPGGFEIPKAAENNPDLQNIFQQQKDLGLTDQIPKNVPSSELDPYKMKLKELGKQLGKQIDIPGEKKVSTDQYAKNKVTNFFLDAGLYNKPIAENLRGMIDPIIEGKEKIVKGHDDIISGKDVLRGSANLVTGTLQSAMNMIPAVVGLNATMPVMNEIGGSVAEGLGYTKEQGEKVIGLIAPFLFGRWIGASSLASFGVDEGLKKSGVLDGLSPEDQVIARELIGHAAFFGTLLGGKAITKEYLDPKLDQAFPYTRGVKADLTDPKVKRIMDDYVERFNEKKTEFEKKQQEAKTPEEQKKAAADFNKWAQDEIHKIIQNEKPAFFRNIKKDLADLKEARRYKRAESKEPLQKFTVDPNQVNPETGFTDFKFDGVRQQQDNVGKQPKSDVGTPKSELGSKILAGREKASPQLSLEEPKGNKPIITPAPGKEPSGKPIITPAAKLKELPAGKDPLKDIRKDIRIKIDDDKVIDIKNRIEKAGGKLRYIQKGSKPSQDLIGYDPIVDHPGATETTFNIPMDYYRKDPGAIDREVKRMNKKYVDDLNAIAKDKSLRDIAVKKKIEKQPYEFSKAEYEKIFEPLNKAVKEQRGLDFSNIDRIKNEIEGRYGWNFTSNQNHKGWVEQAIKEGKITSHPDYPELTKGSSPANPPKSPIIPASSPAKPIKVKRKVVVVKESEQRPEKRLIEETFHKVQEINEVIGSQKLTKQKEARDLAKKLREKFVNAKVEKDGKKWYLYLDGKKQTMRSLGLVEMPEVVPIDKIKIKYEDARKTFRQLTPEQRKEQLYVIKGYVEPSDLPPGYGQKWIDQAIKDIESGQWNTKAAMLVREAAVDILTEGKDVKPTWGTKKSDYIFLSPDEIRAHINEPKQIEPTEDLPDYIFNAQPSLDVKIKKIQDQIDNESQAMFPDDAKIKELNDEIKKLKMQQAQDEAKLDIDAEVIKKIKSKIEKGFDLEKSSLAELKTFQVQLESQKDKLSESNLKLLDKINRKIAGIESVGEQTSLFEPDQGSLFNAKPPSPENLKKWIGKSAVVDQNGDPVVVYHGTNEKFTTVKPHKGAQGIFWFSSNREKILSGNAGASGTKIILDLYVKIENPAGWKEYDKYGLAQLQDLGYDGAILPDGEGGFDGFVFNADQVKSASKNNGDYSPEKKSMLMNAKAMPDDGAKIDPINQREIFSISKATGLKKIKSFRTEEGRFEVYDVDKDHRRGDMFTLFKRKQGYVVRNVNIPKDKRRYGLATEFYIAANNESIRRTGYPLVSSPPRTLRSGETIIELSDDGVALWESFVKKGYAEKLGDKNYRFFGGKPSKMMELNADVKDLIAVHNLTEDNLLFADKVGGLAMPSMAIVRTQHGFEKYGAISLIAGKDFIDPQYNKVFNRDIYSPTYPTVYRYIDKKKLWDIIKKIEDNMPKVLSDSYSGELRFMREKLEGGNYTMRDFTRQEGLMVDYLLHKKMLPDPILKREPLQTRDLPEFQQQYEVAKEIAKKYPIITEPFEYDPAKVKRKMDELYKKSPEYYDRMNDKDLWLERDAKERVAEEHRELVKEALRNFKNDYVNKFLEKFNEDPDLAEIYESLYKEKEGSYFDDYRTSKDIKRLLNPQKVLDWAKYNDVIKKLTKDNQEDFIAYIEKKFDPVFGEEYLKAGTKRIPNTLENAIDIMGGKIRGAEKTMVQGLGKSATISAKQFGSIEDIKKSKDRLVQHEEFVKKEEELSTAFSDLADHLSGYYKYKHDFGFDRLDNLSLAVGKIAATKMSDDIIRTHLYRADYRNIPDWYYDEVRHVAKLMKDMPTEYFEAKKTWKVTLDQFSGAVIPIKTPKKIVDLLERNKVNVKYYDPEIPGDRNKTLNEFTDEMFNTREVANRSNYKETKKAIQEYHQKSLLLKDTDLIFEDSYDVRTYTYDEWISYKYDPIKNNFPIVKKGETGYEEGKTKYRAIVLGSAIQPTEGNGWKGKIVHTGRTDLATGLEETIHIFQAEVKRKYPILSEAIRIFEEGAREFAKENGIDIPLGVELFAKSFVAQYGFEISEKTIHIPKPIFDAVVEILNESTTGEKILDKYYKNLKIDNEPEPKPDTKAFSFERGQLELFSARSNAPPFYSKMQKVLEQKLPAQFTPEQIKNILKSGEIKDAEIKWSGIEDWVNEHSGKIDKRDLMDFIKANQLKPVVKTYQSYKDIQQKLLAEKSKIQQEIEKKGLSEEAKKIRDKINVLRKKDDDSYLVFDVEFDKVLAERKITEAKIIELQVELHKLYAIDYKDEYARMDEIDREINALDSDNNEAAKYQEWTLPGGENYEEILYMLPDKTPELNDKYFDLKERVHERLVKEYPDNAEFNVGFFQFDIYTAKHQNLLTPEELKELDEIDRKWELNNQNTYKSPHWEPKNVFAHARKDDRIIPDKSLTGGGVYSDLFDIRYQGGRYTPIEKGEPENKWRSFDNREDAVSFAIKEWKRIQGKKSAKKHLFLQEIQSDWGKDIRDVGIVDQKKLIKLHMDYDHNDNEINILTEKIDQLNNLFYGSSGLRSEERSKISDEIADYGHKKRELKKENRRISIEIDKLNEAVPDMPYKNTWHEFILKALLRKAAEEDYDVLSWTTGIQQINRYSLSKQLDEVQYNQHLSQGTLIGMKDGQTVVTKDNISPDKLKDYIGKDAADKLLSSLDLFGKGSIKGKDLEIGGGWAINLYDKVIPAFLNKYGKKWNAKTYDTYLNDYEKSNFEIVRLPDGWFIIKNKELGYFKEGVYNPDEFSFSSIKELASSYSSKETAEKKINRIISGQSFHSFPITPEMKRSVLEEGQPLFNAKAPDEEPGTPRMDKYIQKVLESMPETLSPEKEARLSELKKFKELSPDEKSELRSLQQEKNDLLAADPFEKHRLSTLIKMKIRQLRSGYKIGASERQAQITNLKKDISAYARLVLPRGEYRKSELTPLLTELAKANDLDGAAKVFTRIRDLERKVRKRQLIGGINKMIRNADRTKGDPDFVVAIKNIRRMKPEDVEVEIAKIYERAANRELTDDEDQFLYMLQRFSDIKNRSVEELEDIYKELKEAITEGRSRRKEWLAKEKKRIADLREKAVKTITGGKEVMSDDRARAEGLDKEELSTLDKIGDFDTVMHSWEWIMDKLSKHDKTSKPLHSFLNEYFADKIHDARNAEDSGVRQSLKVLRAKMMEIYGSTGHELIKILSENSERKDTGATRLHVTERDDEGNPTATEPVKLIMSQNEAAYMLMVHEDPKLEKTFEKMGYTDDTWKALKSFVKPKIMQWARWQLDQFYPEYYKGVNEVYKQQRGVDLQFNNKYMPISRDVTQTVLDQEFLGDNLTEHVSIFNGHLQPRVSNTHAIRIQDIDRVLMEHIIEMEHFKAFASIMKDLRGVFGSRQVSKAIKQYHSPAMAKIVNRFINDFARGGVDSRLTVSILDKVRSNFAKSVIGLNPVVMLKQLTSIPAYLMDMPVKDWVLGVGDFMLNPVGKTKFLMKHSEHLQSRYSKGWERDVILAMQRARKTTARELAGGITFTDILMALPKYGDAGAIFIGGWGAYKYAYDKARASGKTHDEAVKIGIKEFEKSTKRNQQAGDVEDLGELQRQGSWAKLWTLFKTSPKQYYSNMSGALRNLIFKRGSRIENLKRLFVAHVLLPQIFQFAANGFQWQNNQQLRALALGSLNGLLIAGDILESCIMAIAGDSYYSADDTPITSVTQDFIKALKQFNKWADSFDMTAEDFIKFVDELASAMSKPFGISYDPVKRVGTGIKDYIEDPGQTNALRLVGYSPYVLKDTEEKSDTLQLIQERQNRLNEMKKDARKTMDPADIEKAKQYERDLKKLKENSTDWNKQKNAEKDKRKNDPFTEPKKPKSELGIKLLKPGNILK